MTALVEIFKTDVRQVSDATKLTRLLLQQFPHCLINFDLEDCDHILRVEAAIGYIDIQHITQLMAMQGYTCMHLTYINNNMEQILIDRFIMPQKAKTEFIERMQINRNLINKLPGFIGDDAYESTDEEGNFLCTTVAVWGSEDALKNAKKFVQTQYQQQGFDMPAMLERLDIKMVRGLYHKLNNGK